MEEDIRALWELGMATSSSGKKESQFESESQSWESVWSLICGWQIEKAQEKEKRWNVELLRQKKQISWEGQDNISVQYWQGRVVGYCCPDFFAGWSCHVLLCDDNLYTSYGTHPTSWQETEQVWFYTGYVTLLYCFLLAVPNRAQNSPF